MTRSAGRWTQWWWSAAAAVLVTLALILGRGQTTAEVVAPGTAAPELTPGPWINSSPLTLAGLRGRVVLVDFWTYG